MTQLALLFSFSVLSVLSIGCAAQVDPTQSSSYIPPGSGDEVQLQHGYSRVGKYVLFNGKRIDREGANDLNRFAETVGQPGLKLASAPDGESFEVLSEQYTKDKNMVYYKWVSPGRFWVIELPDADPKTFEVVAFNLAKDKSKVWFYGTLTRRLDPATLSVVKSGYVWKDANSVWYQHDEIAGADPASFSHVGQAFYKDKNRVYWSSTPLEGADPESFRSFGENVAYGADKNSVWRATERVPNIDAASFGVVHQMVYKDKAGVYCNGVSVPLARPETMRRVVDLNEHLTALLTDGESYFVYVALWNEVYRIEPKKNFLRVTKDVWEGKGLSRKKIGQASALLTKFGWQKLSAPESKQLGRNYWEQREATTLTQHKDYFKKAWEIITGKTMAIGQSRELARIMNTPVDRDYQTPTEDDFPILQAYRATQRKFDGYYSQWLQLNPEIKSQVKDTTSIDVAEIFAAEMFGLTDSKMPIADLLSWKDVGTKLLLDMSEITKRNLRPPSPESPLLRAALIDQAEAVFDNKLLDGKSAESRIDLQIERWRVHFPEFLSLKPKAERHLRQGKALPDSTQRIKAAKAVLVEYEIPLSNLVADMLSRQSELNAVQTELLAQLFEAESNIAKQSLNK